jgi:hypothetical protein
MKLLLVYSFLDDGLDGTGLIMMLFKFVRAKVELVDKTL